MKKHSTICSRRSAAPAMTLIEVVAGLALLGSLLGAAVLAQARLTRQWSQSAHRLEAVQLLGGQLQRWDVEVQADDGTSVQQQSTEYEPRSVAAYAAALGSGQLSEDFIWAAEVIEIDWLTDSIVDAPRIVKIQAYRTQDADRVTLAAVELLYVEASPADDATPEEQTDVQPADRAPAEARR